MIRNYAIIAFRNIRRNKVHSILNIAGLAIGMASAILILLWVQDELSYDRFYNNSDRLFRVLEIQYSEKGEKFQGALTPNALGPALKEEYPEVLMYSRYEGRAFPIQKGNDFILTTGVFADQDFPEMFDIQFISGDKKSALSQPHSIVLTEETAKKFFKNEDPIGKTLKSMNLLFTVTGVVKALAHNSSLRFDCLVPFTLYKEMGADLNAWNFNPTYTFIELRKGTEWKDFELKIGNIIEKHFPGAREKIFLQNITQIHLYSYGKYKADFSGLGDIAYIRLLSMIAVFILIIACINYINLTTAQSARRAKEIGLRKVAGAGKRKIITQFLGESLLIVFAAHIIAMIIVELLLPHFNSLIENFQSHDLLMMNYNANKGGHVSVNYRSISLYTGLLSVILFCGILAGGYPAFYLSSLKTSDVLKRAVGNVPGNVRFRRILVIFQFTISILLIICTLVVRNQFIYMKNKDLGFSRDNLGYFQFGMSMPRDQLKTKLYSDPDILSVSISDNPFSGMGTGSSRFSWEGKPSSSGVMFSILYVDEDYAKTFQLRMKAGRFFSLGFPSDQSAVVINEKAAEILGFKDPVGETVTSKEGITYRIIGIVNDFNFKSLHTKIDPLILFYGKWQYNCFIKMKPDRISSAMSFIKKSFASLNQPYPLIFNFLDDDYNSLYWAEQRMAKILGYFSVLALVISCLGLIGLSSFLIERRTKEIGVRKVNGATSNEIFTLLSKEYLILVSISLFISWPIAWLAMHTWMQSFAYHTGLSLWIFFLAGIVILSVALFVVSIQSFRAAGRNPVEALRYE